MKTRTPFSGPEDKTIKELYKRAWSRFEIAYQIFSRHGVTRTAASVGQRSNHLMENGELETIAKGKRFITQEAIDWFGTTHKEKLHPSPQLELREHSAGAKTSMAKRKTKRILSGKGSKKSSVRQLIGFTRTKGKSEPNPSYAVMLKRSSEDELLVFRALLESAVDESKTAIDILEDLRLSVA